MNTLRVALVPALLGFLCLPAGAAAPANRFDGNWSVTATTDSGACQGPFRYPIVIRGGTVDEAMGNGIDASGRAAPDGSITGEIRQGIASVAVTGRLKGSTGSGRWTLSGAGSCTGRWTARRA